ncbi:hypothetical protein K437DRAFT_271380 [Tilletiaria anomala UBC 951]|uniref:Uncharacterized protein n=1 Tax=Tilletiaria anomala (strain ATCC 24038 / CBS 436.72 / UBC 951) TaxID=1037660 RepID=A0A066UZS3_TILAU|nr:uncharacterized protein K437DRAFT_271380 [Tilletiaria anomala UBC 951]KDN34962.1 hypothetical protein K437DRAFT_271380 [Tilletiaria anomala UBC 951]
MSTLSSVEELRLTLDPQADAERYDDVAEDLNDILPLWTALIPAERQAYTDEEEESG